MRKQGGGGPFKFLLVLLLLLAAGFGYAMFHYKESPQQVWKRLVGPRREVDKAGSDTHSDTDADTDSHSDPNPGAHTISNSAARSAGVDTRAQGSMAEGGRDYRGRGIPGCF